MELYRKIIAVCGPTASGKTKRAVSIANALHGEIVSADSRQVYRNMTIGTGKDLEEYGNIPFHLIDIVDAGYKYNLYEYVRDARKAIADIQSRDRLPVISGGTGLYLEKLLDSTNLPEVPVNPALRTSLESKTLPELKVILEKMKTLHNSTDVDTVKRAVRAIEIQTFYKENPSVHGGEKGKKLDSLIIGIDIDRNERRQRISSRLKKRIDEGMIDEVDSLLKSGIQPDDLIYYGLEYKFVTLYLIGNISFQEMVYGLEIAIHQFAKRQMTWFRGMERRGHTIHWLPWDMPENEFIEKVISLYHEN